MSDVSSELSGGPGSWAALEPMLPETGDTGRLQSFIHALREEKSPAGTPGSLPELHEDHRLGRGNFTNTSLRAALLSE